MEWLKPYGTIGGDVDKRPLLLIDAIANGLYAKPHGVRVAQGQLVHRIRAYNERRGVWQFYCGDYFHGNAHHDRETLENPTCVGCLGREPWLTR